MKTLSALLLLWILPIHGSYAEGGSGSHGGDEIELEAWSYAQAAAQMIQTGNNHFVIPNDDYETVFNVLIGDFKKIKVQATDEELFDSEGNKKSAINIPSKSLIKINRSRWKRMETEASRLSIVVHEFLGAAGLKYDLNYAISKQFRKLYNKLYEQDDVVFNGGLYHQIVCDGYENTVGSGESNITLKSRQNGPYHVFINGVFKGECKNPKTVDYSESRDTILNTHLIAAAEIGVVQKFVHDFSPLTFGSCVLRESSIANYLQNTVYYVYRADPKLNALEQEYQKTAALALKMQELISQGTCAIPYFPGMIAWMKNKLKTDKETLNNVTTYSDLPSLKERLQHYRNVLQNGIKLEEKILDSYLEEAVYVGGLRAQHIRNSGYGLSSAPFSKYELVLSGNNRRAFIEQLGFNKDEIADELVRRKQHISFLSYGMSDAEFEQNEHEWFKKFIQRGMNFENILAFEDRYQYTNFSDQPIDRLTLLAFKTYSIEDFRKFLLRIENMSAAGDFIAWIFFLNKNLGFPLSQLTPNADYAHRMIDLSSQNYQWSYAHDRQTVIGQLMDAFTFEELFDSMFKTTWSYDKNYSYFFRLLAHKKVDPYQHLDRIRKIKPEFPTVFQNVDTLSPCEYNMIFGFTKKEIRKAIGLKCR